MSNTPNTQDFWAFVRERETIRERRAAGTPPPWTDDPVLREYRFCNVRRADDAGTRFYVEHVARGARVEDDLLFRTILYRLVNNAAWHQRLGARYWTLPAWRARRWDTVKKMYAAGVPTSSAYLSLGGGSPKGGSHLDTLARTLDWLVADEHLYEGVRAIENALDIEEAWAWLLCVPNVGPFIAMQVERDLVLTGRTALSTLPGDFAYIGPGAQRGLELLYGEASYKTQYRRLRRLWARQPTWLQPRLELADVQHALCEARKYWEIQAWQRGERSRPKLRPYPDGAPRDV